jgi:hypothetical protein
MISGTIERAAGVWAYREQMCNMVIESMLYSEQQYTGIRQKWPRLYDLWRGTWNGRFHPHKNNVHIPLIFSAIWADAARKAASSLSTWPPVSMMGFGRDDQGIARKQEQLVGAQFKDDSAFLKQVDVIVGADLYGVSVMQVGWKRTEKMRILEQIDRMPLSGKVVRYLRKGKVVEFDGPETLLIDLLDFFPQPTVARLRDMKWVVRRYFLDLDDVRYLASIGTFSAAELARMERDGAIGAQTGELMASVRRFQTRSGMDDETARFMNKYSRPIEIIEFWGDVPSELSPDGVLQRVVTVANRRYLMRNNPNPYNHGLLPFVSYSPTPDIHYFYAPGKAEVVEKLQIVGNRYINQSLDAADLMIDPMWFYDRSSGLVTRNFYARPGRLVGVNGNPNNVIQPMQPIMEGLSIADNKLAQMREFLQMGTGIVDDAVQGLSGDSRQTAREFVGRREAAGTRLMLESRIYEECMLESIANQFMALNKQFLEPPIEINVLGDGAMIDEMTGRPLPASKEILGPYDLMPNYTARALGATMGLSKQMQQQNLLQLLQALSSPLGQSLMGQINAVNFFRGIFKTFEVPNINDIFVTNPMLQQFMESPELQQMMQGRGLSGVPTSGQIASQGPSVIAGIPGLAPAQQGAAGGLLAPPDISNQMAPVGMAA